MALHASAEPPVPLAPRDLLILTVLAEAPLHGYGIIKAVELRSSSGVFLDPANLYRALRRMRRERWIEEVEDDHEGRRTFRITVRGRTLLDAEIERLERLLADARPSSVGRQVGAPAGTPGGAVT